MFSNIATLEESLEIKNNCLIKMDSLKNTNKIINIPEGIKLICDNAFENCTEIEEVNIPNSVTEIGSFAFKGCKNLKVVSIPNNVSKIGKGLFAGCSNIGNFTFSNKFISFSFINGFEMQNDSLTFFDCTINKDLNLYIPDGVETIGENAFSNCSKLIVVTIPQSVTAIENKAFSGCKSLCIVDIPNSIINFGRGIFAGCTNLMPIKISNRLTSYYFINGLEIHDRSLTFFDSSINKGKSISIPQGVTAIGQFAFYNCSDISYISFPKNIRMIEQGAFAGCGITQMTIPEGITRIEKDTFKNCLNLEKIIMPSTIKYIDKEAFVNCPKLKNNISSTDNFETYFKLSPL